MEWYLWHVVSWKYCRISLPDTDSSSKAAFSVVGFSTVIHKAGAWELNKSCAVISSSEEWSFLPLQIHLLCHLPLPKMQGFESPLAARRTGLFASSKDEVARLKRSIFSVCAFVKRCTQGQRADLCSQNSRPHAPGVVSASGTEWAPILESW